MRKKKKSFTVEDMEQYQQLKASIRLQEIFLKQLRKQKYDAQRTADRLGERLEVAEKEHARRVDELSSEFSELEAHPELINIPETSNDPKQRRQPKTNEDIKGIMLATLVKQHMDHCRRHARDSERLPLKQLAKSLGIYFELYPRSVSNFFKNQFEGEELVGGTKNRALKLPLKTKRRKKGEEVPLMLNKPEGMNPEQIHTNDDKEKHEL